MTDLTDAELKAEIDAMLSVKRLPAGSKVFVGDMTDIFGEWVPDEMLDRMFAVFALRPDVTFQLLTKRPERMRAYMSWRDEERGLVRQGAVQFVLDVQHARGEWSLDKHEWPKGRPQLDGRWPLPNVWLGTSVEDQEQADKRIPVLLATPAAVRFLSVEPLLGPVDLTAEHKVYSHYDRSSLTMTDPCWLDGDPGLDWVIVGGESGPGARPCDVGWIRGIVSQCQAAGVPVFVKQVGSNPYLDMDEDWNGGEQGRPSEIQQRYALPVGMWMPSLRSRKGGDPEEWPEDLRVREFPHA